MYENHAVCNHQIWTTKLKQSKKPSKTIRNPIWSPLRILPRSSNFYGPQNPPTQISDFPRKTEIKAKHSKPKPRDNKRTVLLTQSMELLLFFSLSDFCSEWKQNFFKKKCSFDEIWTSDVSHGWYFLSGLIKAFEVWILFAIGQICLHWKFLEFWFLVEICLAMCFVIRFTYWYGTK